MDDICGMLNYFGKNLLCLILFPLLFWGCIPYGICSGTFLVLCTIRLLHVVLMILYSLDYSKLLILPLVGLTVYSCNRILQICGFRLIGGEEFLIVSVNLDYLLPAVVICLTIEYGSRYLRYVVLLWISF